MVQSRTIFLKIGPIVDVPSQEQNRYAIRVTIGYAIAATLWIFFSDQWLTYLTDFETVMALSTGKGLTFVTVTSALLFFTLRNAAVGGHAATVHEFKSSSSPLLMVFLMLAVAIGSIGFTVFRIQSDALKDNALSSLQAVAELKVEGVSRWLAERRANARALSSGLVLQATLTRWLKTGSDEDRTQLTNTLRAICESYGFAELSILDPNGRHLLGDGPGQSATITQTVHDALSSGQLQFLDLAQRDGDGTVHMGFIAPLYLPGANGGPPQPLGALHFDLRPEDFLYPFLASWPLSSASGESLLARREGDSVLYLSPLRFAPKATHALRMPLSAPDLPIARAFRLQERRIVGRDYRQAPVLAAALPVPGSPWILLAKMDEQEALTGTRHLLAVTGGLMAAALCVAAVVLVLLWHRQRLRWALHKLEQSHQVAQSEAKLRSYIEHSPIAVFVVDETGRFVDTNPAGIELSGHGSASLRTMTIADSLVEEDRERGLADFADLVRTGRMEAEYQVITRDGRTPFVLLRAARISENRFIGFSQDITERRQIERALRQAQKLARLGSYNYDIGSDRWSSSEVLDDIFGIGPDYPRTAESWLALVHPARRQEMATYLQTLLERGQPFDAEYKICRNDTGEERWVHGLGTLDLDRIGKPLHLIGTIQDITERKQAEAQIQALNADLERRVEERTAELVAANRELDSFAYAVSHDLRAPLRAMSGFSSALIEDFGDQLNSEARLYLAQITAASRKMGELVEGLLVLSRCTRGGIRRDQVDVSALAAGIESDLRRAQPHRQIECRIEPGLRVRGDARMIEVVLRNLLSNAWKYSQYAAAAEIRVYGRDEGGQRWICVSDNGAGFSMEHAGKLFKPFQRLHREDEFPGIGIGLATVQRIVDRHSGVIIGEGAVGQGATFRFTLLPSDEIAED